MCVFAVQQSMVSVAKDAGLLLLRYPTCLELWRLGHTSAESSEFTSFLAICRSATSTDARQHVLYLLFKLVRIEALR